MSEHPDLVDSRNINAEGDPGGLATPDVEVAVAIDPSSEYQVTRVEFWTGKAGAPQLRLTVKIREDSSGRPGSVLREAQTLIERPNDGWYGASFPEPYPASPKVRYWLCYMGETVPDTYIRQLPEGYKRDTRLLLPFLGPDKMFRSPQASSRWVSAHPGASADSDTYYWSLDGEHWRGPFRGAHMIGIYGHYPGD